MIRRRHGLLGGGALLAAPALAQPIAGGRPVRLVVPFPPGGAVDITARIIAERLTPTLGQTVLVENRAGAGGTIGADSVAKAAPDGTTLGLIGVATFCAAPTLYRTLPFDPLRDFTPISLITTGSLLCVVNAEVAARRGWTDFATLIAWARANPEQLRMGSSGTGTTSHLLISAVNQIAGTRITHVPYRGGAPAINDLLAGTIEMMFDVMPALMPHVAAGKFRPLAVSSAEPLEVLPDVPGMRSFGALGLGELDVQSWNSIAGPARMDDAVVARLFAAIKDVAAQPEFAERLRPSANLVRTSESPEAMRRTIREETPRWVRLVQMSGAQLE